MKTKKNFRIVSLLITFFLLFATNLYADLNSDSEQFVQNATAAMKEIEKSPINSKEREQKQKQFVDDFFSINGIGRRVIAKYWANMQSDQQKEYMEAYNKYICKAYVPKFSQYAVGNVKFISARQENSSFVMIKVQMDYLNESTKQSFSNEVNFVVKKEPNNQMKIYDMSINNIGLVSGQQGEFYSIIESGGKNGINILIQKLNSFNDGGK